MICPFCFAEVYPGDEVCLICGHTIPEDLLREDDDDNNEDEEDENDLDTI